MDIQQILSDLRSQRDRLDEAISGINGNAAKPMKTSASVAPKHHRMSAAARKRIGEAKRKWWAERKKRKR